MRKADRSIVWLLCAAATLIILAMLAVIHRQHRRSWHGTSQLGVSHRNSEQGMTAGGIFPAIYGTVLLVLLMSLAAVPFGVIVAIYFAEYAQTESRFYRWTRMAVNNLAGVPSIVLGSLAWVSLFMAIGRGTRSGTVRRTSWSLGSHRFSGPP